MSVREAGKVCGAVRFKSNRWLTPEHRVGERIWCDDESGCILWMGSTSGSRGYAVFSVSNKTTYVHRWVYEQVVGPIPSDMTIDHECNVPACVNPEHLRVMTMRDNCLRGDGPTARLARRTHCAEGHRLGGDNVHWFRLARGERSCRRCHNERAKRYRRHRKAQRNA